MIGEKLKEIREKMGLNKKEFAKYLGLKYTTYNNYETESREPSSDFLILISEKFDVSIDYLLGLKDEKEILHSYKLRSGEYEHIKKYRILDTHGKDIVDTVLDKEYSRSVSVQSDKIVTLHQTELSAAHQRTDVKYSPEEVKSDLDSMSDENF